MCVLVDMDFINTRLRGAVGKNGLLVSELLDFVEVMLYHDKFKKLGIDINDRNQEDMYIEIIEKDDETLLDDLEKYLSLKENISKIQEHLTFYTKCKNGEISLNDYVMQNLQSDGHIE
jgi:hypothetical protein